MKQGRYEVIFGTISGDFENGNSYGDYSNKAKAIAYAKRLLRYRGEKGDYVEVVDLASEFFDIVFRKEF